MCYKQLLKTKTNKKTKQNKTNKQQKKLSKKIITHRFFRKIIGLTVFPLWLKKNRALKIAKFEFKVTAHYGLWR